MAFILLRSTVRKEKPSAMRMALIPGASFSASPAEVPPVPRAFPYKRCRRAFLIFPEDRSVGHGLPRYFLLP